MGKFVFNSIRRVAIGFYFDYAFLAMFDQTFCGSQGQRRDHLFSAFRSAHLRRFVVLNTVVKLIELVFVPKRRSQDKILTAENKNGQKTDIFCIKLVKLFHKTSNSMI